MIHSTGFYRNKAKNIQEACTRLVAVYDGQVPAAMDDLLSLAGVARKTANVVLGTAYHIADGIVVDTHVKRLAQRLGLSTQNDPEKIERDLQAITPREEWIDLSHLLIFHGRRVCDARNPNCPGCVIRHLCPAAQL
jgi:endonuclease-3